MNTRSVSRALGWFSIGLGFAELLAPRRMAKATGLKGKAGVMPLYGVREITSGIGILASKKPTAWMWSRVLGDAMDLATIGCGIASGKGSRARLATSAAMVVGVTALDYYCSQDLSKNPPKAGSDGSTRNVFRTLTINRPAKVLYEFWRKLDNLPQIIPDLKSVQITGPKTQHWVARGPAGIDVEWDAEIVQDLPADRISWRSLPGATVANSGTIIFEELTGDRGTVVRLKMSYEPPAGRFGAKVARLFGKAPEQQSMEFLRKFKQFIETGEISTTVGQPSGRKTGHDPKFDVAARKLAEIS